MIKAIKNGINNSMRKDILNIIICFLMCVSFLECLGCKSALKKEEHTLQKILIQNMRYRRPPVVGALDVAVKGEEGYESQPRPGANFDCKPMADLYAELNPSALRNCLIETGKLQMMPMVSYRLVRDAAPYLEIEEGQEFIPPCIAKHFKKIPVPREIFFQAIENDKLNCYSSRIPIFPEEFAGIKDFLYRTNLHVFFRKSELPTTQLETILFLSTWSLAPFFSEDKKTILARLVPDELCKKCLGRDNLFKPKDPLPPLWPQ